VFGAVIGGGEVGEGGDGMIERFHVVFVVFLGLSVGASKFEMIFVGLGIQYSVFNIRQMVFY